ncbi:hypothetical protein SAMN04488048_10654 [Trichococcus flocculiformis]|nr:Hypothetical protein TES5_1376 [Trichococcus sp. ES5]SHF53933.1 hypothetical protein SAMN04488048_10654 [Trichococcus flocculiformis]
MVLAAGTGRQLRQGSASRRTACVSATNSGERMLAGGQALSGGRPPAKPSQPEVTFYRDIHLRQGPPSPAENASAGERVAPRRTACVLATSFGERMMAGGESLSGGRPPAKPSRPEVTFYRDLHLRQGPPSPALTEQLG